MFSKAQKLVSPFGILGDDAKLAFKTQPEGVRSLAERKDISESDPYWEKYVTLFDSTSDVFALISHNDIRRALSECPNNVATLIRFLCNRLIKCFGDHTFPAPPPSTAAAASAAAVASVASLASSFMKSSASAERNATKEALNCIRVLQRVLPVLFESESGDLEQEVLWKEIEVNEEGVMEGGDSDNQFVIADDDDDDEAERHQPKFPTSESQTESQPAKKTLPSLAERLIGTIIDLMFCCGFTLPTKLRVDHHKVNYVIWETGVGSTLDPGPTTIYDANKVEVLRLLLILLSRQIYVSPAVLLTTTSNYTVHLVQRTPRRHVLTVLCSLLNTAMNSQKQPVSVGSVAGKLPYNHLVFKGEDIRHTLVSICLQILCVLLDYQSLNARDVLASSSDPHSAIPTAKTNSFRYFVAKLHRTNDFRFIHDGVLAILHQHIDAQNNLLPGSRKPVQYIIETIVFFWKMIELNKKFRSYVLGSEREAETLVLLLCICMHIKDKPEQHGLCRALSYIVQTLSADITFSDKLNSPMAIQLPAKWNFSGSNGDFMINAIYSIVATTSGALNSLYPALIIAIANVAPHLKNLSISSSSRLVQLVVAFSSPPFLLSDEGHPRLLFFMLEVFNGIIMHQFNENPNVIYALLRSHKAFEDLGTFTLIRGLREIQRIQNARNEPDPGARADPKNQKPGRPTGHSNEEKAQLLTSESASMSLDSLDGPGNVVGSEHVQSTRTSHDDDSTTQPLVSPSSEHVSPFDALNQSISEKARGKLPERDRSMSMDTTSSLERIAASGIGRNGFVPTQEWVTSWQRGLPLDPVLLTITELLPKVHALKASLGKSNITPNIIDLLRSVSLQNVLPPLAPLSPRRFVWSDSSVVWLTSLIWGEVYLRGMTPLGVWNSTNVRLFYVKHTPVQQLQISEAVSHVVGGLGGLLGRGSSISDSASQQRRPTR